MMTRKKTPRRGRRCPGHASGPPKPTSRRSRSSTRSVGPLGVRREDQKPAAMTDTSWRRPHERVMTSVPTRIRLFSRGQLRSHLAGHRERSRPKAAAGEVDKDNEEAALAAATATKTHHSARKGSGARSPQVSTQGRSATDFCWAPKRRRRCLLRPEAKIRGQTDRA